MDKKYKENILSLVMWASLSVISGYGSHHLLILSGINHVIAQLVSFIVCSMIGMFLIDQERWNTKKDSNIVIQ